MSLSLESRYCGKVFVLCCTGRIVSGEESSTLEAVLTRGLLDSNRMVLNLSGISHVDSSGMGLLVRYLSRLRNNGGDLRLAAPSDFVRKLLEVTKLSTLFRVFDAEEEAIVSFLKEPVVMAETKPAGPLVLFLDQSPDLCAFVRRMLNSHGYEAITTCRLHDAKLLLSASDVSCVVLGPDCSSLPQANVAASLKSIAKNASFVHLDRGFKQDDAGQAASDLLEKIQAPRV